jgi:phosphoribosylglycinamide formyltransferase-1
VNKRIVLLASGAGSLASAILSAAEQGRIGAEFVALISDKDSPALEVARGFNIAAIHVPMRSDRNIWDAEIHQAVADLKPDLVVSVGFMRILSPQFVSDFQVINTHPSLLPLYPGAHAVRDALAAGAEVTGTSVHRVDAGLDTGPVILQREVAIEPDDDESTLHERIKIVERALIVEVLAEYGRTGKL